MTPPLLLITRPAEEADRTVEAAFEAGFETLVAPLLDIVPLDFTVPEGAFDSILFTSARAPSLVVAAAPALRALPAHAVGTRTAEEALACGFGAGLVGERDGSAILADIAAAGGRRVLHLAGEATAPLLVPPAIDLVRVPVYAARRIERLPAEALAALADARVFATLLFSARTSRHFRGLVEEAGLAPARLRIVALSPAVAEGAGLGWADVAVAARPDLAGILAAARQLWQGLPDGR